MAPREVTLPSSVAALRYCGVVRRSRGTTVRSVARVMSCLVHEDRCKESSQRASGSPPTSNPCRLTRVWGAGRHGSATGASTPWWSVSDVCCVVRCRGWVASAMTVSGSLAQVDGVQRSSPASTNRWTVALRSATVGELPRRRPSGGGLWTTPHQRHPVGCHPPSATVTQSPQPRRFPGSPPGTDVLRDHRAFSSGRARAARPAPAPRAGERGSGHVSDRCCRRACPDGR